jgi:hypothetical protein
MASPTLAPQSTADSVPLEDEVRQRAYELYLSRGSEPGSELDDWFRAEQELQQAPTGKMKE